MSRSLDRSYPYWLADRLEVPIEDVIWAAEEYARDYPWDDDLEPAPPDAPAVEREPPRWQLTGNFVADLAARLDDPLAAAVFVAMIGLAVALTGGLAVYLLLLVL